MPQRRNGSLQTNGTNGAGVQACGTNGAGVQPWVVHLHVHLHVRKQNFSSRETGNFGISICLDIFIKPIPRSHKEEKKNHFPWAHMCTSKGTERSGADRHGHGAQLDVRTPPHRRHNASRAHTQLRSLARTNETKRFPGWPTPPTSDTSPCAKAKRLPKASKRFPQSQLA